MSLAPPAGVVSAVRAGRRRGVIRGRAVERAREGVADRPDGHDLEARDRRAAPIACAARGRGRSRGGPPRAAGARCPPTARSSPSRPTSPKATVPGAHRAVAERRREGDREGQVEARVDDGDPTRRGWRRRRGFRARRRPAARGPPRAARGDSGRGRSPCAAASRSRSAPTSAWTSTRSARLPSSVAATTLPGRRHLVLDEERPGRDRRPREARPRPSRGPRPRRSRRTGSSRPARGAACRPRSPSMETTASTRCSRVLGPAMLPSFVTWPTRITAIPSPLASSMSRRAASRTWPTLPAGPSSSSSVAVWIESTMTAAGRCARADLDDPGHVVLGQDPDAVGRRGRRAGRGGPRGGAPGRPTPRRSRTGPAVRPPASPAAAWRRSVDFPIPGSPPTRTSEPGHEAAAEDAVELAEPDRAAGERPPRPASASGTGSAAAGPAAGADAGAPRRTLADDGLDERVPGAARRGTGPPSGGRPRRRTGRRSGSGAAPRRARRPRRRRASSRRRPGSRGRPPRPCRRRSSCRACSARGGGARRGRPRSCSG